MLNNKTIFITGGTGSFGKRFVKTIVKKFKKIKKIIIFSRDELKQYEMSLLYPPKKYPNVRFLLGDIRDKDRLNFALNEVTISRKDTTSMITITTYINDQYLNSYWADGLIIATPTGSTGYSLSCGGPIVMPGSENFIITPVAPHNLNVRPLVISDKYEIKVKVDGRAKQFLVALDSRIQTIDAGLELIIKKEDFKINMIETDTQDFSSTLRNKLLWGLDKRN